MRQRPPTRERGGGVAAQAGRDDADGGAGQHHGRGGVLVRRLSGDPEERVGRHREQQIADDDGADRA
jgi:hypothetical protein